MPWLQLTLEAGDLDAETLSDWFEQHGAVSVTLVDAAEIAKLIAHGDDRAAAPTSTTWRRSSACNRLSSPVIGRSAAIF